MILVMPFAQIALGLLNRAADAYWPEKRAGGG